MIFLCLRTPNFRFWPPWTPRLGSAAPMVPRWGRTPLLLFIKTLLLQILLKALPTMKTEAYVNMVKMIATILVNLLPPSEWRHTIPAHKLKIKAKHNLNNIQLSSNKIGEKKNCFNVKKQSIYMHSTGQPVSQTSMGSVVQFCSFSHWHLIFYTLNVGICQCIMGVDLLGFWTLFWCRICWGFALKKQAKKHTQKTSEKCVLQKSNIKLAWPNNCVTSMHKMSTLQQSASILPKLRNFTESCELWRGIFAISKKE